MIKTEYTGGFSTKLSFAVQEALSQCKTPKDISWKNGLLKQILKFPSIGALQTACLYFASHAGEAGTILLGLPVK
jgi:hypothetical protein